MTLLMVLQSQLVDHDIVKLVLVVPQKRYERDASEYSNEAILEFSSTLPQFPSS